VPPAIESVSTAEPLRVEDVKLEARRLKPGEEALWGQKKEECEHAQPVLEARLYRNQSYTEVTAPSREVYSVGQRVPPPSALLSSAVLSSLL
jgi:hypothetical protein